MFLWARMKNDNSKARKLLNNHNNFLKTATAKISQTSLIFSALNFCIYINIIDNLYI